MSQRDDRSDLPADFGSRVAHEIRGPLNLLAGALSEVPDADVESRNRLLALGRRGVDKLERLASRLSFLARLQTRGLDPSRASISLGEICRQAVQRARSRAGRRRVEVVLDGVEDDARVRGDAEMLSFAIEELLENALKHARNHVSMRTKSSNESVQVVVCNDGRLVAEEDTGSLFVLHGLGRPHGGLHVGLGMASAIARAHDGTVELLGSDTEQGTRFALTLPTV